MGFLRFIFNHFLRTVVHDQRGQFDPISLGIGALGIGASALFGGDDDDDPLADIRERLRGLASGVPELIERRKALLREAFAEARETGIQDVGEEFRGKRGFGASTIEADVRNKFITNLARAEAESELAADISGVELEAGILGKEAGLTPTTRTPSFGEKLLGAGGEFIGQELSHRRLQDILSKDIGVDLPDVGGEIRKRPGKQITTTPRLTFEEFEGTR